MNETRVVHETKVVEVLIDGEMKGRVMVATNLVTSFFFKADGDLDWTMADSLDDAMRKLESKP